MSPAWEEREKGRMRHLLRSLTLAAAAMAHQTLTFVPQGQPEIVPPSGPLAAIHPRHWTRTRADRAGRIAAEDEMPYSGAAR